MFKLIRILILLAILAYVAFYTRTQELNSQAWLDPLDIIIYPINADKESIVAEYIENLDVSIFQEVNNFFETQGENYSILSHPVTRIQLGATITAQPPTPPAPDAPVIKIIFWGLKFRWWAFFNTPDDESNHHRVRMFVYYHEALENRALAHSVGLNKGLLAIVHAFADPKQNAQNNIIIAHEFLHTVGASDKYGANNQPIFPDGYADTEQQPLYPQLTAEIMAVRKPLSATQAEMADNLQQCVIGIKTAQEINWLE